MADSPTATNLGILSRSPVFQAAPSTELERLAPRCTSQRYRAGATVIQRGARREPALAVIGRGRLKGCLPSPSAEAEFIVGIFWPGDVLGEVALFDHQPSAGTAIAITDAEVLFVPGAEIYPLLERRPAVTIRLMEALGEKLRTALDLSLSLRFLDLPSRVYQRLLYFARFDSRQDEHGTRIHHGLSQQELADSIGASREALNKLLSEWKRAGVIDYGRGFVVIRDVAALTQRLPSAVRHESILGTASIDKIGIKQPPGSRG